MLTTVSTAASVLAPVPGVATHAELFSGMQDCAGAAFALALEGQRAVPGDERAWLWVQDRASLRQNGRPYHPGLPQAQIGRSGLSVSARDDGQILSEPSDKGNMQPQHTSVTGLTKLPEHRPGPLGRP